MRVHTDLLSDCHLTSNEPESNPSEILSYFLIRASLPISHAPTVKSDRVQPILSENEIEGEDPGPAPETPSQAGEGGRHSRGRRHQ